MSGKRSLSLLLIAVMLNLAWAGLAPAQRASAASILFSSPTGLASGVCETWANACSLQWALSAASSGDEIWVKAGTYYPGASGANSATFQLRSGVALYGGFAGTETARSQRNWRANLTILSGDLDANNTHSGNDAYHVVTSSGADPTAVLDGFTVTKGYAVGGSPNDNGAGLYNDHGSPRIINVVFTDNAAANGGGMFNLSSQPVLINVLFSKNTASASGGGMLNDASSPLLTNAAFVQNQAGGSGGGLHNQNASSPLLIQTTFSFNTSNASGGGVSSSDGSNPSITNSILWGNTALVSGAQLYNSASTPVIAYSDIQDAFPAGSWDGALGTNGGHNMALDPLLVAGTIFLQSVSPVLDTANAAALPADEYDLDGDGNSLEALPYDLYGNPRVYGAGPDLGAVEYRTWFVNSAGAPGNPCTSWADACPDLQSALAQPPGEIWVAAGTYRPGPSGAVNANFKLENGQRLYGGFTGSETQRSQRDWLAHPTILSGDLDASNSRTGNDAYHVVYSTDTDASVRLDGFTVEWGNNPGMAIAPGNYGGGIWSDSSEMTLANLIVQNNRAYAGGGIFLSAPQNSLLSNITLRGNESTHAGGGLRVVSGTAVLTNFNVYNNKVANGTVSRGGGIEVSVGVFTIQNSLIYGNHADVSGGGLALNNSSVNVINTTVVGNTATVRGGGLYNTTSGIKLTTYKNLIIWGNSAPTNPQTYTPSISAAQTTITYSDIEGSTTGGVWDSTLGVDGGHNVNLDPQFVDADGTDGVYGTADDNLNLLPVSPVIDAGDKTALLADAADLDQDGDVAEATPLDAAGQLRLVTYPNAGPDTGSGSAPLVDLGALEKQNALPTLSVAPDQSVLEDSSTVIHFTVADEESPASDLQVSVEWDNKVIVPLSGLTLNGSGADYELSVTPAANQNGLVTITVHIADDFNLKTQTFPLTVVPVNDRPVLDPLADQSVAQDQTLTFTVSAADIDLPQQSLTYTLEPGAPRGAAINPTTGLFSFTPDKGLAPGLYTLTVRVTDGGSPALYDTASFKVLVTTPYHLHYLPFCLK